MKIKRVSAVILCLLMVLMSLPMTSFAESAPSASYVEGEIVISGSKKVQDSMGMLQTASDGDTVYVDFDDIGIESIEKVETYSSADNTYVAEVDGDVEDICEQLTESGDIVAEPNYYLDTAGFTMPSEISNASGMYKVYQEWYMNDRLHIPETWQKFETAGEGVRVAIIDNGFNISALDFPTNLWRNSRGTVGWNVNLNNDNIAPIFKNDGSIFDNTAHGSNIAGIIGMAPNGIGGIGSAYGSEFMLIQAARYVSEDTHPMFATSDMVKAIDFARENGADVINLSLGVNTDVAALKEAVMRAYNAGVAIIAAAGNNGKSTDVQKYYPAAYEQVLGVMATGSTVPAKLASFSDYDTSGGRYYNIAAPGYSILGCNCADTGYTLNQGTSQAAALVTSSAALYLSLYPDTPVQELYDDLINSATETVTSDSGASYSYKAINVKQFIEYKAAKCVHNWSTWTVSKAATCTAKGTETRTCSVCKKTETRDIAALGHVEGNWVVTKPATVRDTGIKTLYCSRCGAAIRTQVIPKLDPSAGKVRSVSVNDITFNYKKTQKLLPTVTADTGVDYKVEYSSSNTKYVTVDSNGVVTACKRGSANITCTVTDEYGNVVSDTCTVKVTYAWWQWIIKIVLFGWIWY